MCTIKAYKFEEIAENEATKQPETFDATKYVTKEELSTIIQELTTALTPKAEPIKSLL